MKMHADEVDIDPALVRRLLAEQFPEWAELPLEPVDSSGTVNALYRLGEDMVVRLPRRVEWGFGTVDESLRWLPRLAAELPVAIPEPLARGQPADGYPCEWGVYRWLQGSHPVAGDRASSDALARHLARLIRALYGIHLPDDGPAGRGALPLRRSWDAPTRAALTELNGQIDTRAAAEAWDLAVATPAWSGRPVSTHGDLMPANLLVHGHALTGVLDWEGFGLGDPACDLAVAWNLLDAAGRVIFRDELRPDEATWARGRGWALCTGLVALPYYAETNPGLAANARYRIGEVLADHEAAV